MGEVCKIIIRIRITISISLRKYYPKFKKIFFDFQLEYIFVDFPDNPNSETGCRVFVLIFNFKCVNCYITSFYVFMHLLHNYKWTISWHFADASLVSNKLIQVYT